MFVDPDGLSRWRRLRSSLRAFDSMHALDDVPEDPKELMENNAAFYQQQAVETEQLALRSITGRQTWAKCTVWRPVSIPSTWPLTGLV